jgi:hypothetical protein
MSYWDSDSETTYNEYLKNHKMDNICYDSVIDSNDKYLDDDMKILHGKLMDVTKNMYVKIQNRIYRFLNEIINILFVKSLLSTSESSSFRNCILYNTSIKCFEISDKLVKYTEHGEMLRRREMLFCRARDHSDEPEIVAEFREDYYCSKNCMVDETRKEFYAKVNGYVDENEQDNLHTLYDEILNLIGLRMKYFSNLYLHL